MQHGISTKILPEAISWHFAGMWNHIPELVQSWEHDESEQYPYPRSINLLRRCISIPINYYMPSQMEENLTLSVNSILQSYANH